jgi:hypothetical protein
MFSEVDIVELVRSNKFLTLLFESTGCPTYDDLVDVRLPLLVLNIDWKDVPLKKVLIFHAITFPVATAWWCYALRRLYKTLEENNRQAIANRSSTLNLPSALELQREFDARHPREATPKLHRKGECNCDRCIRYTFICSHQLFDFNFPPKFSPSNTSNLPLFLQTKIGPYKREKRFAQKKINRYYCRNID